MTTSYITAIGTAIPNHRIAQAEVAKLISNAMKLNYRQEKVLQWIYKKSAIDFRQSVIEDFSETQQNNTSLSLSATTSVRMQLYQHHAKPLALKAIENAISKDKYKDITHLITVSCTGMYAPGLGIDIINALKLPPTIQRSAINFMGCYALFPALRLANSICLADKNANVLIVSVELCTLHLQNEYNEDNLIAGAIFSDGAAALLIEPNPTQAVTLSLKHFYCNLIADEKTSMAWHIGDMGFDIRLSSYVPKLLNKGMINLLDEILDNLNIKKSELNYYAIHPGGKKILQTVEKCFQINSEQNQASHEVLRDYGNMSSVTIAFVLQKVLHSLKQHKERKNILAMAFGPGLTLESALLEAHHV